MAPARPWYQQHAALLGLLALLATQWAAWRLLPGPTEPHQQHVTISLPELIKDSEGLTADPTSPQLLSSVATSRLRWPSLDGIGVQSITLKVEVASSAFRDWLLEYTTDDSPWFDDGLIHTRTIRPVPGTLTWHLPMPARSFRIVVPALTTFSIRSLHVAGIDPQSMVWQSWRTALIITGFAVNLGLLITWIGQQLRLFLVLLDQPAMLSVMMLALCGAVMIWTLPPFQGPDENRHWKEAVKCFRSDGQPGSVLGRLPMILSAEAPRWQSEKAFHAGDYHTPEQLAHPPGENKGVGYVRHWGYPIVGIVSLLFPTVHTTQEALAFYYACRVVSLLCLLVLMIYLWQAGLGSWTLTIFLSLPLVMQQCVIVSTDATIIHGSLLAVLLYRYHQHQRTWANWLMLLVVCLIIVATKPPVYLFILVLPCWHVDWRLLKKPILWIPMLSFILIGGVAGYWYLWKIIDNEGMGLGDQARQQLAYVLTGSGLQQFFGAGMEYPTRFLSPSAWGEPLGWLDTILNPVHRHLLLISLVIAVIADLYRWGRWLRTDQQFHWLGCFSAIIWSVLHLVFMWWSLALIMYLTISEYQSAGIVGMQVRYVFPTFVLLLTWPAASGNLHHASPRIRPDFISRWLMVMLFALAGVRCLQLAMDLQYRFWH